MTYLAVTSGADPVGPFPLAMQQPRNEQRLIIAILLGCIGYQALLCLFNTVGFPMSRAIIGLTEAIIMAACLPFLIKRLLPGTVILACIIGGALCALALINNQFNAKAFRDLVIPLVFFWVGCNLGSPELADKVLKAALVMVSAIGLYELFFLDSFTNFFDIFSYYVSTGNLAPITEYVRESKLQLNGIRPEGIGRTFFPGLLDSHRVSSVFLEPVSLGNFAVLCAAWGLSKSVAEWRSMMFFIGAAAFLMVLADSRFAMASIGLMVAFRLAFHGPFLNIAILVPFMAIAGLLYLGDIAVGPTYEITNDDFKGRLEFSGKVLLDFDVSMLLGVSKGMVYADVGYAHLFNTYGLPLCLLLWACFWLLPMADDNGRRFRALAAIYLSLLLCISGYSFFALKSAAILWFLLGSIMRQPAPASPNQGALRHD